LVRTSGSFVAFSIDLNTVSAACRSCSSDLLMSAALLALPALR